MCFSKFLTFSTYSAIAFLLLVGCGRQEMDSPETDSVAASTSDLAEPVAPSEAPSRWQHDSEHGQLMIGNAFPVLGQTRSILGSSELPPLQDSRTVVVIGADEIAESESETNHWANAIEKFGDDFQFLLISESSGSPDWSAFQNLAQNNGLHVLHAENANESNIDMKFLWPSCTTAGPRVFVVGPDSHIDWIGRAYGSDGHAMFLRILTAVHSGIWDRASEHEAFEEDVATFRDGRRLKLAIDQATNNEDYDEAIQIIQNIHADVGQLHPSERSQLRYIAIRGKRNDVLNEIIAVDALDHADDAQWLAETAYKLAVGQQGDDKDLAVRLATQSCERTDFHDAKHLYSLAFTEAVNSNPAAAVQWTMKARERSDDDKFQQAAEKMIRDALPKGAILPDIDAVKDDEGSPDFETTGSEPNSDVSFRRRRNTESLLGPVSLGLA